MKFNKYLYSEQSPKFPLSVHMELDHVGKSSKCVHGRLYHEDTKTEYVESIGTDVLVSEQTEKAVPYPDWWVEKFAPLCKNGKLLTLVLPEDKLQNPCHTSKIVSLSETDFYKHTNIASYLKFGYESIFRNIFNNSYKKINMNHFDSGVKSLTVAYTGQSRIHDELDITTWEDSTDDSTVYGKIEKKGGRPCCHMKMEFYNEKVQ